MDYQNQNVLTFMEQVCTDEWYVAFTPIKGWCVRLTPKPDSFDDFIAETKFQTSNSSNINKNEKFAQFIISHKGQSANATTKWPEIYSTYLLIYTLIKFFKLFTLQDFNFLKKKNNMF